jgi:hypothetical protein
MKKQQDTKHRGIPGNSGGNSGKSGQPIKARKPTGPRPPDVLARKLRCGAKAVSTGKPCRRWALAGRERCRRHGGATPRGPASPHWKHGFYSKVLPHDIADRARTAQADPELKNLKSLIAVLDVDIQNAAAHTKTGLATTQDATKALAGFRTAWADGDIDAQAANMKALGAALDSLAGAERAWAKLWDLAERKDRLLTGEVNRHKVTADMINADRVSAFMIGMIDALKEETDDRDLLKRVLVRWERIMGLAGVTQPKPS